MMPVTITAAVHHFGSERRKRNGFFIYATLKGNVLLNHKIRI